MSNALAGGYESSEKPEVMTMNPCASGREIEICVVLQPRVEKEMGMEILDGCGYCDSNGHCHYPRRRCNGH